MPGELPKVLLLHHTNTKETSHEIVDLNTLVPSDQADVALKLQGDIPSGTAATAIVTNQGPAAARGVALSFKTASPASLTLTPSAGSCQGDSCSLGDIEAGAEVTVAVAVKGAQGPFTVEATASSEGCDPRPGQQQVVALGPERRQRRGRRTGRRRWLGRRRRSIRSFRTGPRALGQDRGRRRLRLRRRPPPLARRQRPRRRRAGLRGGAGPPAQGRGA